MLNVKRLLSTLKPGRNRSIHPSAKLSISNDVKLVRGVIVIGSNSSLVIEAGVTIDSDMTIGDDCEVVFGKDSRLVNASFSVVNGSTVNVGEGAIIDSPVQPRTSVYVDNGTLPGGIRPAHHAQRPAVDRQIHWNRIRQRDSLRRTGRYRFVQHDLVSRLYLRHEHTFD